MDSSAWARLEGLRLGEAVAAPIVTEPAPVVENSPAPEELATSPPATAIVTDPPPPEAVIETAPPAPRAPEVRGDSETDTAPSAAPPDPPGQRPAGTSGIRAAREALPNPVEPAGRRRTAPSAPQGSTRGRGEPAAAARTAAPPAVTSARPGPTSPATPPPGASSAGGLSTANATAAGSPAGTSPGSSAAGASGGGSPAPTPRATTPSAAVPPSATTASTARPPSADSSSPAGVPPAPAPAVPQVGLERTPLGGGISTADVPAPPRTPAPAAAPPAAAAAVPAAPPMSDERRVRAALDRYQMAYSRLDATAARAVWPSVDRRALERAFGGLASQSISLGQCNVRVNGGSAQADCSGNASWTPRVGGGSQTAARRWRFDLQNTAGEWVIVDAAVR